jgi:hypothetical protein
MSDEPRKVEQQETDTESKETLIKTDLKQIVGGGIPSGTHIKEATIVTGRAGGSNIAK